MALADAAKGDWKQDWEKTVAAAEKEGEISIYGQSRAGVGKALLAFKDAYPKIKINFVGGFGKRPGQEDHGGEAGGQAPRRP